MCVLRERVSALLAARQACSTAELFCARAIVGLQVAESVLDSRQHMSDKGPREVYLLIVTVRLVERAAMAHARNVAQRVVAVGALGGCRLLGFVFRAHPAVVDAGENMNPLTAERVMRESVSLGPQLQTHGGGK